MVPMFRWYCNIDGLGDGLNKEKEVKKSPSDLLFQENYQKYLRKNRPRVKVIKGNQLWNRILREHAEETEILLDPDNSILPHSVDTKEWIYLKEEVLPIVLPALEETMSLANKLKVEEGKNRAFDYADTLAHFILNLHTDPNEPVKILEDLPEIKAHLEECPRPSMPRHKLWSRKKAATLIQKNVRGWLVRKRPEIQELRTFWKAMRKEMSTRVGPAVPRPKDFSIERDIMHLEFDSDMSDETLYADGEKFFKKKAKDDESEGFNLAGMKLPPLDLQEADVMKLANMPPEIKEKHISELWKTYRTMKASKIKEANTQTEEQAVFQVTANAGSASPFVKRKGREDSAGPSTTSSTAEGSSGVKPKRYIKKPEISREDAEHAISFEDLTF